MDEYRRRWTKAARTEKLARTFSKYALTKLGYTNAFLLSRKGNEAPGVVDLVAVKKSGDTMDMVLFQVKGNQKVSDEEIERLRLVAGRTKLRYGTAEYRRGKWAKVKISD